MTVSETAFHAPEVWYDLSAFQRDILEVLREIEAMDAESYGLEIKRGLERRYAEEVNHGRLYPNLDDLVQMDLVEKSRLDRRTNEYLLSESGCELLDGRRETLAFGAEVADAE